jgi:hypothetical protein
LVVVFTMSISSEHPIFTSDLLKKIIYLGDFSIEKRFTRLLGILITQSKSVFVLDTTAFSTQTFAHNFTSCWRPSPQSKSVCSQLHFEALQYAGLEVTENLIRIALSVVKSKSELFWTPNSSPYCYREWFGWSWS